MNSQASWVAVLSADHDHVLLVWSFWERAWDLPRTRLGPGEDPLRATRALMALDGQGDADLAVEAQVGATVVVRASRWDSSQPSAQVHVEHLAGLPMADPLIKSWLLATRTRRPEHLEVGIGVRARQIASEHGHAVVQPAHVLEALRQIDPVTTARVFPETMLRALAEELARPPEAWTSAQAAYATARLPGARAAADASYALARLSGLPPQTEQNEVVRWLNAWWQERERLRQLADEYARRIPDPPSLAHAVAALGWARLLEPGTPGALAARDATLDEILRSLASPQDATTIAAGAEGGGRSTLAQLLADRLGRPDYHGPLAGVPVIAVSGSELGDLSGLNELLGILPPKAVLIIDDTEVLLELGVSREVRTQNTALSVLRQLHEKPNLHVLLLLADVFLGEFVAMSPELTAEVKVVLIPALPDQDIDAIIRRHARTITGTRGLTYADTVLAEARRPAGPDEQADQPGLGVHRLELAANSAQLAGRTCVTAADIHGQATTTARESVDTVLSELDSLVGLAAVKDQIRALAAAHQANQMRSLAGQPTVSLGMNLLFLGDPGTGKTTVARLIARMYAALGLLRRGHLVEVTRTDLVGAWVGWTAPLVRNTVRRALGGVLFIDEAYALTQDHGNDFGHEAIVELLRGMEEYRTDLVVIAAGYGPQMAHFLNANPGLQSRFTSELVFPNYDVDELTKIWCNLADQHTLGYDDTVINALREYLQHAPTSGPGGNARYIRTLFQTMYSNMGARALTDGHMAPAELDIFTPSDVPDTTVTTAPTQAGMYL